MMIVPSPTTVPITSIVSSVLPIVQTNTVGVIPVGKMVGVLVTVCGLSVAYPISIVVSAFISGAVVTAIMGRCRTWAQTSDCAEEQGDCA